MIKSRQVPLFKPYVNQKAIANAIKVLQSGWIGEGPVSEEFERKVGDVLGVSYPVLTNSGTAALHLALILAGVHPGDEVITTAMTCTATNHPILMCGATPIFADIDYQTGNVDPADIERRITEQTKAILVTHWGGYPCDMESINQIGPKLDKHIAIIQDGAHAQGAYLNGYPIARWSDFFMTSFQAIKTVTMVDGGLLGCRFPGDAEEAKRLRWFAIDRQHRELAPDGYYNHRDIDRVGYKYQPNDVAAAIGLGNLEDFVELVKQRQRIAKMYENKLRGVSGVTPFKNDPGYDSAYWLFSIHVENRDDFIAAMKDRGVGAGVVHRRNDVYGVFGGRRSDLPNLDRYEKTYVSIPIHNMMTYEDAGYVIECIKRGW